MHELSIAMSIVAMATEEVERHGAEQVNAVHLRLGTLSGVVKDALLFSYEMACQDTPLAGSRLVIEDVPIVVYCPACRKREELLSMQSFVCPGCATPTPEVLQGRELQVTALEIQ